MGLFSPSDDQPWQIKFICYTTLLNLVRFAAPILFYSTKYLFGNESLVGTLPLLGSFSAAPEGWEWAVFIDFTCGCTCAILVYYIYKYPTDKLWVIATAWTAYSCLDMVNAVELSFEKGDGYNSPFPESFFSFTILGIPALFFKLWCTFLIVCQVTTIYLLLTHETCVKYFLNKGDKMSLF